MSPASCFVTRPRPSPFGAEEAVSIGFRNLFPNQTGSKTYTRALIFRLGATCIAGHLTGCVASLTVVERFSHPPTFASLRKKCIRITRLANVPRDGI